MNQTRSTTRVADGGFPHEGSAAAKADLKDAPDECSRAADAPQLARALEKYRALLEAGEKPSQQEFLAGYPEIAGALSECLAGLEFVHAAAPYLSGAAALGPPAAATAAADMIQPAMALGDFRIVRELGRGGMGLVYEAQQLSLGRRVALKVLPFAGALDPKQLQRFKHEAQAAAQLHHANIVPVFYVGCERGVHFYAMQLIEGHTLAQLIDELRQMQATGRDERGREGERAIRRQNAEMRTAECGLQNDAVGAGSARRCEASSTDSLDRTVELGDQTSYAPDMGSPSSQSTIRNLRALSTERSTNPRVFFRRVANLGIQAAEALEHAHQMGVVHRDVKPSNLLVDLRGNLWVTDFGLARFQTDAGLTMTGDLLGTLRYMSPESAAGGAQRTLVDHRTDIYSLGVTLYELLTLQPLFACQDRQELLRQIANQEPRLPRRIDKRIPEELETIVLKAVAKNPAERYASAQELADDLERLLEDKPIRARRPGLWMRWRKWMRRHKLAAALCTTAALLVLVIGSVLGVVRYRQRGELERFVSARVTVARGALGSGRLAEARLAISEARTRLESWPGGQRSLPNPLKAVFEELEPALAAREARARFQKLADDARYLSAEGYIASSAWWNLLPKQDRRLLGIEKCREALAVYRALKGVDWATSPNRGTFKAEEIQRIEEDALEMLLLEAELDVSMANEEPARKQSLRRAIAILDRAEGLHGATHSLVRRRGNYWKQLGNEAQAEKDTQRAETSPPATALDYYLLGHHYRELADGPNSEAHGTSKSELYEKSMECFVAALQLRPDHYWSIYQAAWRLQALGRYQEARLLASNLIALRPEAESYWVRGQILLGQSKSAEALPDFEKAVQLRPDETWDNKALLNAYMAAGQQERGVALFSRLIESQPDSTAPYIVRAQLCSQLGKFEQTLRDAQKVLSLDPRNGQAHVLLGDYYQESYQVEMALKHYARAEQLDPASHLLYYHRGWMYAALGELDKALDDFTKDVERDPTSPFNRWRRARVYLQLGQIDKARTDHEQYVLLSANSKNAVVGRELSIVGRHEEAIPYFDRAIELDPKSGYAYVERAVAWGKLGRYGDALADFDKALEVGPNSANVFLRRAQLWERRGEHDKALADLKRFVELEADPQELNRRAWSYVAGPLEASGNWDDDLPVGQAFWTFEEHSRARDPEKALPMAEKAVRLAADNAACLNTLGLVYLRLDRFEEAIEVLERGVKANFTAGTAGDFLFLSMAHQRLGHNQRAKNFYQKALRWLQDHPKQNVTLTKELEMFRQEAEELLKKDLK